MAALVHIRVLVPSDRREAVVPLLTAHGGVTNIVLMAGAAVEPAGDVLLFDVAREAANEVLEVLHDAGVSADGSVMVLQARLAIGANVDAALDAAPGESDSAVLWPEVDAAIAKAQRTTRLFYAYFVVASIIGAAGVLTDSPILIVGAMVVGPEYGPIAAMSWALERLRPRPFLNAALVGALGSTAAVGAAALMTWILKAIDRIPDGFHLGDQANAGFITHPDIYTAIVASVAAVAGVLSLAYEHSGALVGVLVSVTTIPAIAAIGVGIALRDWDDMRGAAAQLGANLVCLVIVGALTFAVLRRWKPPHRRRAQAGTDG
jgi:uncharacterized hydrophobic protein (TIGR00271 family)